MATTITATRQVVEDYQTLFVNRRTYTMQSVRPHPESGRHYYFRQRAKWRARRRAGSSVLKNLLTHPTLLEMDVQSPTRTSDFGAIPPSHRRRNFARSRTRSPKRIAE